MTALGSGLPVLHLSVPLIGSAVVLAERLDHPVYDCLYLALAVREDTVLVTADRIFHERVGASELAPRITWLAGGR